MIAAAEAIKTAPRSDPGYVRHLFDQFSADYDTRMIGQLSYAAPQILLDLAAMVMPGREELSILDLGCGTGLAGRGLQAAGGAAGRRRPVARHDRKGAGAAASMIICRSPTWKARLATPGPAYDLILAADTLVYLGDLDAGVRSRARAGWRRMVISSSPSKRRRRRISNWAPSAAGGTAKPICAPLRRSAGLSWPGLVAAAPRQEADQPVAGFAVALTPAITASFRPHCALHPARQFSWVRHGRARQSRHVRPQQGSPPAHHLGAAGGRHCALAPWRWCWARILMRGFAENGFRLGSQLAWRYAFFVFFAALVAGPLCRMAARLFPLHPARKPEPQADLGLLRQLWRLSAVGIPAQCDPAVRRRHPDGAVRRHGGGGDGRDRRAAEAPGRQADLPDKMRKVLLAHRGRLFLALLCLMALARISGPHRPDIFYDISLSP